MFDIQNRIINYVSIIIGFSMAKLIFIASEPTIQLLLMLVAFVSLECLVYLYDEFGKVK